VVLNKRARRLPRFGGAARSERGWVLEEEEEEEALALAGRGLFGLHNSF
jgi:hypothetical protein